MFQNCHPSTVGLHNMGCHSQSKENRRLLSPNLIFLNIGTHVFHTFISQILIIPPKWVPLGPRKDRYLCGPKIRVTVTGTTDDLDSSNFIVTFLVLFPLLFLFFTKRVDVHDGLWKPPQTSSWIRTGVDWRSFQSFPEIKPVVPRSC